MTVIGEAVVAIAPASGDFITGLESQLKAANFLGPGELIGGALVAGLIVGLAKIGQAFGAAKVQIQRETGETGAALTASFNEVKAVMVTVPDSIGTVTTAVDELTRRGVPLGKTFTTLAQQALALARITKSDLAATVETTTTLMARFNVPLLQQPKALDAIFKGYQASGKSLTEFTGTLTTGAVFLQQFGFNISQSAALIATLDKAGVNATTALAGLRKAFGVIAKEGADPKTVLEGIVKEFSDGTPKAQAMSDAMKLFGARSGAELATAIASGKFKLDDLLKSITDGQGGILATAAATRTFSETLGILKNQALVALQPLGSAVWSDIKTVFFDAVSPVENVAVAFGHLGIAVAPIAAVIGGALFLSLKLLGPILDTFAIGLDGIASVLDNRVVQALVGAAVAIGAVALAVQAFQGAGGWLIFTSAGIGFDLNPVTAGLIVAAAAITALGVVMRIFGGSESAAAKEAKDLGSALFDTASTAGIFKSNIGSAAQGLQQFLVAQDAKGKLRDLDAVLQGTSVTLGGVAAAVTGSKAQFDGLVHSLANTDGFNAVQRSLLGVSASAVQVTGSAQGLTNAQQDAVIKVNLVNTALNQQRDALLQSTTQDLKSAVTVGQLTQKQADYALSLLNSTGALGGIGAATTFANEAAQENALALAKQQVAALTASGSMAQLKSEIIAGTFSTTNAVDAAAKFGIGLDAAKQIITDTTSALKTFVSQGLAGFDTGAKPVSDWEKAIQTAFTGVEAAAKKGPAAVAAAHAALVKALDPADVVRQVQAEAAQITQFSTNIQALVGKFPDAVRALLANPDKQAAAAFAQALLNNPAVAKQYNDAQHKLTTTLGGMSAFLSGPGAQDLLTGSTTAGTAVNTGFGAGLGGGGAGGSTAAPSRSVRVWIDGVSKSIQTNTPSVSGAAKTAGAAVAASYGNAVVLPAKTTDALVAASAVIAKERSLYTTSGNLGGGVGVAFLAGVLDGLQNGTILAQINAAAAKAMTDAVAAARAAAHIHSPSADGIDIGHQFIAGIALGLTHLDPVLNASRGIGTALVDSGRGLSATLPSGGSAFGGTSAIVLDLTVHLVDGTIVKARPVTVNVPRSTLNQRVAAEVTAQ